MSSRCQIVLPGLFDLPIDELASGLIKQQLPNLNRLVRFASVADNHLFTIDASLSAALGWAASQQRGLPVASAFASDSDRDHLLVEAVHLHPDLHNAILIPIDRNQRNSADISKLINDLNELFKDDCHVSAIHESVYLMRLESLAAPNFYPHPYSVLGKPANPYVEQSRTDLPWYRLLNEIQMFLHQHPVNQKRLSQGLLSINSLWCWGGGSPASSGADYAWYSDDIILNRFASSIGLSPQPVDGLISASTERQAIIVDLRLLEATKAEQTVELDALLLDIENRILAPALVLFRDSVRLRSGCELDLYLHPWSRFKFWRRQRNLEDWQRQLQSQTGQYS